MDCITAQAAVSARHDREPTGVDPDELTAHLLRCRECSAFDARLRSLSGPLATPALAAAPREDLAEAIAARAADVDRAGVWWALRLLLGLVAVGYLVISVPDLLFSNEMHHAHLAHHLGAFGLAYGVALLFVAVRPATARALVPFTIALAVAMGLLAAIDIVNGQAPAFGELQHLLELAGLVLVWLLATRRGWSSRPGGNPEPDSAADTDPTSLRLVEHDR